MDQKTMEALKERYITSEATLSALAREAGVAPHEAYRASTKGGWVQARDAWRKDHGLEPLPNHRGGIDWSVMYAEFISGDESYSELAKRHGVAFITVKNHAVRNHWKRKQLEYRAQLGDAIAARTLKRRYEERMETDWAQIREAYVTGEESYTQLSKRYDVTRSTICNHAHKEGWRAARLAYRAEKGDAEAQREMERIQLPRKEIDWAAMRTEYVTGNKTMMQLADEYGTTVDTVYKKSQASGWQEERMQARETRTKAVIDRVTQDQADQICRLLPPLDLFEDMIHNTLLRLYSDPNVSVDDQLKFSQIFRNLEFVDRVLTGRLTPTEQLRRDEVNAAKEPQTIRFELSPELDELAR